MKKVQIFLLVAFLAFAQMLMAQSNPTVLVDPLDPDVPGGVDDQVRDLVFNILHGGGGEFDTASIRYRGNAAAFGRFWRGEQAGIGVESGLILSNGQIVNAMGNNETGAATDKFNEYNGPPSGDSSIWKMYRDLYAQIDNSIVIPYDTLGDAAVLEFWYKPYGDEIILKYIFASDEYRSLKFDAAEDVALEGFAMPGNQMFDLMGIFITNHPDIDSTNLAQIYAPDPPPPDDPPPWTSVYNINANKNVQLFVPNPTPEDVNLGTEFDGLTRMSSAVGSLVIRKQVTPCIPQKIKIAIADFYFTAPPQYEEYSGYSINSAVFLEAGSFTGGEYRPKWTVDSVFENTSGGTGEFGNQIIENCADLLVTFTLEKPLLELMEYPIPFRIESDLYRDSIDVRYEGSMNDDLITNDTIWFSGGDSVRTVRVSARDIKADSPVKVKFIFKTDPCDGPIPPIGGGSFSGKILFDLRHNDPITFTFDPAPGFKQYEAYCKETIDLNIVNETKGGVLPLTYAWPSNPVPPVETYSYTVNNSPDFVPVTVSDGCANSSDATVKIINKPIHLNDLNPLAFCKPGMEQEVLVTPDLNFHDFPGYVLTNVDWSSLFYTPPLSLGSGNPKTIVYDDFIGEQIYYIRYDVTDVCGGTTFDSLKVDQTGKLDVGEDKYLCKGESVELSNFTPVFGNDPNNYKWYIKTSPTDSTIIGTGNTIVVTPDDTTTYYLYIYDKCEQEQIDSLIVYVDHFLPEITISPSAAEVCPGEMVTFTANDANVWLWTPGGETTRSISRNETIPGVYTYTLTASSDYCIDKQVSASYEVFPQPSPAFSFAPDEEACTG